MCSPWILVRLSSLLGLEPWRVFSRLCLGKETSSSSALPLVSTSPSGFLLLKGALFAIPAVPGLIAIEWVLLSQCWAITGRGSSSVVLFPTLKDCLITVFVHELSSTDRLRENSLESCLLIRPVTGWNGFIYEYTKMTPRFVAFI